MANNKNVKIEIIEDGDKTMIKMEKIDRNKSLSLLYHANNVHSDEFQLTDNNGKVEIEKIYPVLSSPDGDIDYDFQTLYPCQICERKKDYILKLERKIEYLKNLFKKILD